MKIEPGLLPVENPAILKPGNKGARLDISGMGVWNIVTALRGVRGRKSGSGMKDLSNVNFDFVPEGEMYESF